VSRGTWQDTNPFVLDDRHVIVTSDRVGQQHGWLLELTGAESPRDVTPAGALGSSPSPDRTRLVYAAAGGRGGIAMIELAGGAQPIALTSDASDAAPVFTHDGAYVLFERTAAGVTRVMAAESRAGATPHALAIGAQPAASRVADTVVFVTAADTSGARQVMVTDLAGATPRAVPGLPAAAWQRPRFSADGRRLLLVRGYQEIVVATLDGSDPPRVVWSAGASSVSAAAWATDGSIVAAVGGYEGDLWLAEGSFP
jgi:Tol biopolymer transport system component